MRVAVVGAGGVGGFFGAKLLRAGCDVTFIARGATLEALRTRGIRIESIDGDFSVERVAATDDLSEVNKVDVVLVAVKAWQVAGIAPSLLSLLHDDTVAVPLENGLDAPEELAMVLGRDHVAGGLCAIVSYVAAPGVIRHAGAEPLIAFGELDNRRSERLERLRDMLVAAGVNAEIPPDIHRSMWTKFLFIAPLSGIGAATRVPVGLWRTMPETRALAERAVAEILSIATARGVHLAPDAQALTMKRYDGLPPDATASLQRDIVGGRPSELEAQLGAVVRMGRESGISTPVHEMLYHLLLPQESVARG